MRKYEFIRMQEFKDFNETKSGKREIDLEMVKLEKGDCFLNGNNMINQKQNKEVGQPISYYKVIKKTKNGVEYTAVYDTLEEDNKGEKE